MISRCEKLVLNELRKDSRQRFIDIARNTGLHKLSVSNAHGRLLRRDLIRCVSMIDYSELGFAIQATMIMSNPSIFCREELNSSAADTFDCIPNINSIHRLRSNEYMVEACFRSMKEMHEFLDSSDEKGWVCRKKYHIIERISSETFMV